MVAEPRTWVDVEGAVRAWARQALSEQISNRVFFGFAEAAAMPQIVVQQVAGTDDQALLQFDVWGATKAAAADVANALCAAADALGRYLHEPDEGAPVLLHGAHVESKQWRPDEESDTPRYVVDITFTASAATSL